MAENAKIEKFKCDILRDFQTLCLVIIPVTTLIFGAKVGIGRSLGVDGGGMIHCSKRKRKLSIFWLNMKTLDYDWKIIALSRKKVF